MNILTIDTSERSIVGYVSFDPDNGRAEELACEQAPDARHHAETLTPMVEKVLGGQKPDAVVVGTGPAAFTGLRAGLMTGEALARAWDISIYGVSSLDVLALGAAETVKDEPGVPEIVAAIDARRKELFVARLKPLGVDDVSIIAEPKIITPAELPDFAKGAQLVATPTPELYPELSSALAQVCEPALMVRLAFARLARSKAGEKVELGTQPQYLRRPDIHVK